MRDALFGLAPDEDPAEALRSQIRTLQRRLRDQEQHHQDSLQRAQSEAHAHSEPIEHILGLLYQIVNERLLDDIPLDERGQRLKSLLSNACRISNSTRLFGW